MLSRYPHRGRGNQSENSSARHRSKFDLRSCRLWRRRWARQRRPEGMARLSRSGFLGEPQGPWQRKAATPTAIDRARGTVPAGSAGIARIGSAVGGELSVRLLRLEGF
jgi:hypothetical protein